MDSFDNITFDLPKNRSNVIKVIGVGGGRRQQCLKLHVPSRYQRCGLCGL